MHRLEQRIADLEADVTEMRQHNLRLAELVDVVQELLVSLASREDPEVTAAIERFRKSL
jgi:hypothetical protein